MNVLLIIAVIFAAIYVYAAIAYYYGFKNWHPLCGCQAGTCGLPQTSKNSGRAE